MQAVEAPAPYLVSARHLGEALVLLWLLHPLPLAVLLGTLQTRRPNPWTAFALAGVWLALACWAVGPDALVPSLVYLVCAELDSLQVEAPTLVKWVAMAVPHLIEGA